MVILAAVIVAVLLVAVLVTTVPDCHRWEEIETGIDAGPGLAEIDRQEHETEADALRRLEAIERERRATLDRLEAEQRREYEEVRERGPDAVLDWLRDFDKERFR